MTDVRYYSTRYGHKVGLHRDRCTMPKQKSGRRQSPECGRPVCSHVEWNEGCRNVCTLHKRVLLRRLRGRFTRIEVGPAVVVS